MNLTTHGGLTPRASSAVSGFLNLIDDLDVATENLDLAHLIEETVDASGLKAFYEKEGGEKGQVSGEAFPPIVDLIALYCRICNKVDWDSPCFTDVTENLLIFSLCFTHLFAVTVRAVFSLLGTKATST